MSTLVELPTNPNRALWEKGDFTQIAETMRESGEALVRSLNIKLGMKVLDLGCGDGTTAIPAARRGADVLGVDIASNLVDAGNKWAQREKLANVRFERGDAKDLAWIADEQFDFVVSIFGAMFAPDPFAVAREMVRVTRPGGRIVMGNWIPGDPTLVAQILKISAAYSPPPPEGFVSPVLWGNEAEVTARFEAAGIRPGCIRFEKKSWWFVHPGSPLDLLAAFRQFYGPTMNAFAAAELNGLAAELEARLAALVMTSNVGDQETRIPARYLEVCVQK